MGMDTNYEFKVSFNYIENSKRKQTSLTINAKNEAEALQKAKEQLSLHPEGENFQVISGASILRK